MKQKLFGLLLLLALFGRQEVSAQYQRNLDKDQMYEVISDVETDYGYYIKLDGEVVSGIRILKDLPTQQDELRIPTQAEHPAQTLYPGEIREWGLERGDRFISAEIRLAGETELRKVFLEEVIKEPYTLLRYRTEKEVEKETYDFLYTDGEVIPISENYEELRVQMRREAPANCPKIAELDKTPFRLSRMSIRNMQKMYARCNTKPVHRPVRAGVKAALTFDRFHLDNTNAIGFSTIKASFSPSLFVDIPIDGYFSIIPEIGYKDIDFEIADDAGLEYHKLGIESFPRKSLVVPVTARYTANGWRSDFVPFVEAGPSFEFRVSEQQSVIGGDAEKKLFDQCSWMYGFTAGGGFEWHIRRRNALQIGLRYTWMCGHNSLNMKQRYKTLALTVGITL